MEIIPYNGTTLAFIGDAVMTLWVRERLVRAGYQKPNDLQKMTSHYVSAKAQANSNRDFLSYFFKSFKKV